MLCVCNLVVAVQVDTSDLNFVTWSCSVYKVVQHDALLLPWNSAWWDSAWSFLDSQFLVIAVNSGQLIKCVRTIALATNAHTSVVLCFCETCMVSWSFQITTDASDEHLVVLRENA